MSSLYSFDLPPECDVIQRNRTITTYYAQLYRSRPVLFKWAGMAAFASYHIGEKLQMWDWETEEIRTFSETCEKKNKSLEDDFQVIRIINNKIFLEIGSALLAFSQLDYETFRNQLVERKKDDLILNAFEKLNDARSKLKNGTPESEVSDLIWEANVEILWHEQSRVVQPLFDKLSTLFSGTMSLIASFDYTVNHKKTNWQLNSRFILFMLFRGLRMILRDGLPDVTNLEHRWRWISSDLLRKWKIAERRKKHLAEEINTLSSLEPRDLDLGRNSA